MHSHNNSLSPRFLFYLGSPKSSTTTSSQILQLERAKWTALQRKTRSRMLVFNSSNRKTNKKPKRNPKEQRTSLQVSTTIWKHRSSQLSSQLAISSFFWKKQPKNHKSKIPVGKLRWNLPLSTKKSIPNNRKSL